MTDAQLPPIPEAVLRLAESWNAFMPLGPNDERIVREDAIVFLGAVPEHPAFNVVQHLRMRDDEVAAKVEELRALLRSKGRLQASWEVGPSARPSGLVERLLALGMKPFEEPTATAMILRRPLPETTTDVCARRAETIDDYVAGFGVLSAVFGERKETPEQRRARAEVERTQGHRALFVGELEGRVVAAAHAIDADGAVVLGGSATLPEARHRGAYRALVAARHAHAVRRGTPMLVIQAGAMSRPILARLGFETTAVIQVLVDDLRRYR